MPNYRKRNNKLDDRSIFANYACDLLVEKHNRQLTETIKEVGELYEHFKEHVRNVYELSNNEIPLFGLYEVMKYGRDNFDSDKEYNAEKQRALIACNQYYKFDLSSVIEWEKANLK